MDDLTRYADFRTRLRSVAHALGVIIAAFLVGALVLPVAVLVLVNPFYPLRVSGGLTIAGNLLLTMTQFVGFVLVAVGYVKWQDVDLYDLSLPSLRDVGWMGGGFVLLFVVAYGLSIVITVLGLETATNAVVKLGQENPQFFLYMIPVSLLFIGPGEELVFRGVVQGLFRKAYGVVPAVVITSVLFGVAHYLALVGEGQVTYIAIATGLGLVLGAVYERTENVVVPIVIHGAWNAMLFTVQWYAATNPEMMESLTLLR
ncbi:CPBP family intramembrane glutamic endopeptidase [Halorhabdus amylolytica]|uniref:CPBP family intramembrane glutamic endopeptidase n=1 Tax=Halorhabdus amylolytica TaxID=2559573 RepID=UPI0010A9A70A|nr:CPBP family intramembrane glutamic endopeptidase [Halorhabdus amylolytica]